MNGDDGLGPSARALLDAGRDFGEPTFSDETRIRAGLSKKLGLSLAAAALASTSAATASAALAPGAVGSAASSAGTTAASGATWAVAIKSVSALVVAVLGAGVVTVVAVRGAGTPSPNAHLPTAVSATVPRSSAPAVLTQPSAEPASVTEAAPVPIAAPVGVESPASPNGAPATADSAAVTAEDRLANGGPNTVLDPADRASTSAPRVPTGPVAGAAARADSAGPHPSVAGRGRASRDDLVEQVRGLRQAQAALRDGRAAEALQQLDEHARHYPHSMLHEERSFARVMALCALGQTAAARQQASQLFLTVPNSVYSTRLKSSCAADEVP